MTTVQLPAHRQPTPVDMIVWLEGEANYTRVHYRDGSFTLVTHPLQWFDQKLDFIRVHRSAIVNPMYVRDFKQRKSRAGWVQLHDGKILPVSRSRLTYTDTQLKAVQ